MIFLKDMNSGRQSPVAVFLLSISKQPFTNRVGNYTIKIYYKKYAEVTDER